MEPYGMIALVCAILLVILIPADVWKSLLYVAAILVVGWIGFVALLMLLVG